MERKIIRNIHLHEIGLKTLIIKGVLGVYKPYKPDETWALWDDS